VAGRDSSRTAGQILIKGETMNSTVMKMNRTIEDLTLNITQEIHVRASLEVTFAALLEQLGPLNETPDGKPLSLKIEPWPGGRWYRDLGGENGHLWGHVQSIKRPTLLEFYGPLFMSYPVNSNVQYRLSEEDGGTLIKFHHMAFGLIADEHRAGVNTGWTHMNEGVRKRAEAKRSK
jgi:Activator of Hsp90 ATPase homolog 1-like protein